MVARSKRALRKARPASPQRRTSRSKAAPSTPWPTIEAFLDTEEGNITFGAINHTSLGYTAIASDEHNMLVSLVRREGETLHKLLDRLERALGPAIDDQVFVDEINGP
jgi:hypothetical protein